MKPWAETAPVLIIEDYEPVAELERRALVRAGVPVRVVGRVADALQLLQRERFSAILLDYQLPDGDPWSVVELANARTPRIPVVVVTAMGNERVAAEAIHHGVAEYVRKTGTFYEELPEVVARVSKLASAGERLRRSDALVQLIAQHARDVISTTDARGAITSISPACRTLLGYEPEELIGTRAADLVHPEDRARSATDASSVVRYHRKDGTWVWVETSFHVPEDPATGFPVEVITITRDITERMALEAERRKFQNRMKNGLQVVSGLFDEKLPRVEFGGYARALVERLLQAHGAAGRRISAVVQVEQIELAAAAAIPCGLILDELVTNALKHAFPGGRAGSVHVTLRRTGPELVELHVRDDGVGLPADLDPVSLGLGLISMLAAQLGAQIDVKRENGTAFSVRFGGK